MSEEKTKWKKEVSAGGVVYKKHDGSVFVLLVKAYGMNWNKEESYWTFPKGGIDQGETSEIAALREVSEEGEVKAKIIDKLGYVKFFRNYDKVLKFVDYYLMEYESGDPKDHDEEMLDAQWIPISEADSMLKYDTDKEILEKAIKIILSNK